MSDPVATANLLPLVGILVQLGTLVLLSALLLSLRPVARRWEHFRYWLRAWIAVTVAIAILALYYLLPGLLPSPEGAGPLFSAVQAAYQFGKLLFAGWLLLGAISYARGRPLGRTDVLPVYLGAAAFAIVSGIALPGLGELVRWQAAVNAPVFGACAWLLGTLPQERRPLGIRVLTVTFAVLAGLWALYFLAFSPLGQASDGWVALLRGVATYNTYIDAAVAFVLGLGMVVTVVEQGHAEADVTRRAQLEETLASERRLAEVLRAAHEGIVTLDAERRIVIANPAAEEILGVAAGTAAGRPFDSFLAPDEREALWLGLAVATRRSEAHPPAALRREMMGRRADGSAFPMEVAVSTAAVRASVGNVIVLRDLTEQERERGERDRLQQQVAHVARLEAVGRMVSGVAHELNNPLTAILAFAQDLLNESRSEADHEALTVIVEQAQRCRVIVGDLLIFARNRRDERRRLAPGDVVARVLRAFERDSARNGVVLDVIVAPDLPPADMDPIGMEQVLTNLLTNAFQATPRGGRVTIEVRPKDGRVEFVIEDTGPGISAAAMPRLFEPFFTTKPPGYGTGLGLSVSHAIVQQHEGDLHAENRGGDRSGARFIVSLPFVDRRAKDGPREAPPAPAEPTGSDEAGRRVLLVDDEESIRIAMRRSLERRGWRVDEAADGREALLRIEVGGRQVGYDAVVTDLRMPGMSGIELHEILARNHPALLDRTVVITGDTASPTVAEFLVRTSRPCLQKPFDMRALAELLDRVSAARAD